MRSSKRDVCDGRHPSNLGQLSCDPPDLWGCNRWHRGHTARMSAVETFRLIRGELNRLAHAGLDSFAYRERAIQKLRAALGFDAAWWWSIDPASAFFTSGVFKPLPSDHVICGGLHSNEFGETDYNKFRILARPTVQAGVLSAATGGQLERSDRYRQMLAPLGYEHELRLALSDNSTLWGGIALLREPGAPDFTPAETRNLASLGQVLTEGLRIGIALGPISVDRAPNGPGMLVVDDDLKILTITPTAERWLNELTDGSPGLPDAIRSVVGYVRQLHESDIPDDRIPRARVRGTSGRWLAIYASRTRESDSVSANTAVIIQEAKPSEIAPLIIDAYGLSPREALVTRLVLQGLSTKEIASEIHVSPYTVQDYLKMIFAKVGVRSRRELVATIFDQHHRTRFGLGENPPESDGAVAGIYEAHGTLA
jgi:DNA-binding CsgD family transcriptional regulator